MVVGSGWKVEFGEDAVDVFGDGGVGDALLTSVAGVTLGTAVTVATVVLVSVALRPVAAATDIVAPWPPVLAVAATCALVSVLASTATGRVRRRH